jgi:type IV secretion system protein VirB9
VPAGALCAPAAPTGTAATLRTAAGATRARRPARRPRVRSVVRAAPADAAPVIAARRQVPGARPVSAAQLLDAATREYHETGVARPVVLGAVTAFPYGVSDPVVTCGTLRACLIDLEPGERLVTKPLAGDMKPGGRWYVGTAPVGADSANTLVWVKPTDCGLATNLVLSTDRRVYTLALESPACGGAGHRTRARAAASHFTFYFPDSTVPGAVPRPARMAETPAGTAAGRDLTLARDGAPPGSGAALAGISVDVARMNFDYRVKRDKRFPWAPAQVFDDAVHTFIKIPPEAAAHPAPALFELTDGGGKTLMNYTVRDGFYVVDRTFRRAVLSLGQGKHEQRIDLENPHFGTPVVGTSVPVVPNPAGRAGGR